MRRLFAALAACLLLAAPALAGPLAPLPEAKTITVKAGKTSREAILYKPAATKGPFPVALVFHGGGGGAEWMAEKSEDLTRTLAGAGYVVVYMNGSSRRDSEKLRTWNAVHCCAYAQRKKINEAVYADSVVDTLAKTIDIDRTRIYLMGHSNGAMLTYRLAGAMKNTPRAIAPISGAIFDDQPAIPDSTSIFMYHAIDDTVLSYDGSPEDKAERWRTAPHVAFAAAEAKLAGMKGCRDPLAVPIASGVTMTERYCAGGSQLVAVTGKSGGHEWPSRPEGYTIESAILGFFETQR